MLLRLLLNDKNRSFSDQEKVLSNIADVPIRKIGNWRQVYNLLKHTNITLK